MTLQYWQHDNNYIYFDVFSRDLDTLIHLLKGSLGSGILAMPLAFFNAGLAFGVVATIVIGVICTYCVHMLVDSAHTLYRRTRLVYTLYTYHIFQLYRYL